MLTACAHPLDLAPDILKLHEVLVRLKRFRSAGKQQSSSGSPAQQAQATSHDSVV
jgi:hypothetical protein